MGSRFHLMVAVMGMGVICTHSHAASAAPDRKPNIVFIMADDLGWADVGFNGSEFFDTPNIDRLRQSGMNFTAAYPGAANCMPSRSCIMTGMYTTRTHMWTPGGKSKGNVQYMKFLVPSASKGSKDVFPSLLAVDPSANTLAKTLKSAGYTTAHFGKWHLGPDGLGFDINDTNGKGGKLTDLYYGKPEVHVTLTDASIDFIKKNRDRPFFIYLCFWDVHIPLNTSKEYKVLYEQKKASRQDWTHDWNTTYAGMIHGVDLSIKRIVDAIHDEGLDQDTLIIFTSDNGGYAGSTYNEPLRSAKGSFYEGGIRVPTCMRWDGVIKPGSECDIPITGVDYLPTFAELAGVKLPDVQPVDGRSFVPLLHGQPALENRSIFWHFPLYLSGSSYDKVLPIYGTDTMYWRATPCSVIRKGDWKLIYFIESESYELYNVKEDVGEKHELSKTHPEMAQALYAELKKWQQDTKAEIPSKPNPDFNPNGGPVDNAKKKKKGK